jgi:hypothetical protein
MIGLIWNGEKGRHRYLFKRLYQIFYEKRQKNSKNLIPEKRPPNEDSNTGQSEWQSIVIHGLSLLNPISYFFVTFLIPTAEALLVLYVRLGNYHFMAQLEMSVSRIFHAVSHNHLKRRY